MIVKEDDGDGVLLEGKADDVARRDERAVDRADEDVTLVEEPVPLIEEERAEVFLAMV
jgi:hypothetical protein